MKAFITISALTVLSILAIVLVGLFISPVLAALLPVAAMVGTMLYISIADVMYNVRTKGL